MFRSDGRERPPSKESFSTDGLKKIPEEVCHIFLNRLYYYNRENLKVKKEFIYER